MEDGGAGGLSAIGDGGQAAISLMPDDDRTQVCIFESLQLEGLYVGDWLYKKLLECIKKSQKSKAIPRAQKTWRKQTTACRGNLNSQPYLPTYGDFPEPHRDINSSTVLSGVPVHPLGQKLKLKHQVMVVKNKEKKKSSCSDSGKGQSQECLP